MNIQELGAIGELIGGRGAGSPIINVLKAKFQADGNLCLYVHFAL